jgi:hypothetical protein
MKTIIYQTIFFVSAGEKKKKSTEAAKQRPSSEKHCQPQTMSFRLTEARLKEAIKQL